MLQSTAHQPVTNARASGDYHPGASNYLIGESSLFYWAVGVAPSKDDWWTSEKQPGNPYSDNPSEPNWQLQALVVGLSTGPNGPSDGIGCAWDCAAGCVGRPLSPPLSSRAPLQTRTPRSSSPRCAATA